MNETTAAATRSAAVTGAASGIGRALVEVLVARGNRVHLADIDEAALDSKRPEPNIASASVVDVATSADMEAFAARTGPVDLLCLNAGVLSTVMGAPWEATRQEWDRVLGANLHGVVNGLRAFVPLMVSDGSPRHILITASLAGAATWPGGGPYAASKHAVLAVAEQAALNLAGTNVGVTVLCPALVRTAMSSEGEDPREVAVDALNAIDEGTFAMFPLEWRASVVDRAVRLADGRQPRVPSMNEDRNR